MYMDDFDNMSDVDVLLSEIKSKIIEEVQSTNKETIERLTKENAELAEANRKLLNVSKAVEAGNANYQLFNFLMNRIKKNIEGLDGAEKAKAVYEFLDCFFEKDFVENTYEVPLWLGCATQYYSNRAEVFSILRALNFQFPNGIDNFRLPLDWTEDELDEVFEHMGNHVNCNNCVFKDNLRFWKPNALDDPIKVCSQSFTEIPWQYLLRNPLLKKEKYLAEIGRMFCVPKGKYYASQWLHFAYLTKYQELTADEIKIIINNIDYTCYNGKDDGLRNFLLNNIKLVDNEDFLDILYNYNKGSWDFKRNNTILEMPRRYVKYYMRDTHDLEWLKNNKDKFTREQITELTLTALGVEE